MIDKINFRFENDTFYGSFRNCVFRKKTEYNKVFSIASLNKNSNAQLWILKSLKNGRVRLVGSLRKWYYGENSLLDFNKHSFIMALQRLANTLDMSLSELGLGIISFFEIGLNIRTRIECTRLLKKICAYKSFYREDFYQNDGTLYFGYDKEKSKNSIRTITIYDKCKEIAAKQEEQSTNIRKKKAFKIPKKHGYHFTRLEIKIKGKKSFKAMHLDNVNNLNSLIEKWNNLYVTWTFHVAKIYIAASLKYPPQMTRKERMIAELLERENFASVIEKTLSKCTSETSDGLKAKRYRERRAILDVILKYGDFSDYNTYTFKSDVALTLIRQCKKESKLSVGAFIRNLWKPSYTLLV